MDHFDEATKARIKAEEERAMQDAVEWLRNGAIVPPEPPVERIKRWLFRIVGRLVVFLGLAKISSSREMYRLAGCNEERDLWSASIRGRLVCTHYLSRESVVLSLGRCVVKSRIWRRFVLGRGK